MVDAVSGGSAAQGVANKYSNWAKVTDVGMAYGLFGNERINVKVLSLMGADGKGVGWARLNDLGTLEIARPEDEGMFRTADPSEKADMQDALRGYIARETNPVVEHLRANGISPVSDKPFDQQASIRSFARKMLDRDNEGRSGWARPSVTESEITKACQTLQSDSADWDRRLKEFLSA